MKKGMSVFLGAIDAKRHAPFSVSAERSRAADYFSLTKPRLNLLVVFTAAVGYYLGADGLDLQTWMEATVGTALVAGGAAGLNQVYERDTDSLMRRTRWRPLAANRLTPAEAVVFSLTLAVAGLTLLAVRTNIVATALALATLASYNVIYTPMKRRSQLATLVGAVPGALPPMIGWAAATGSLALEAWALFAIVFIWQIPHFMAIAWMYRDDFRRGGFPLLPVVEPDGRSTAAQSLLFSVLLVPTSLAPFFLHAAGWVYAAAALAGGAILLGASVAFAMARTDVRARVLFIGSIAYLSVLWALLIVDRVR